MALEPVQAEPLRPLILFFVCRKETGNGGTEGPTRSPPIEDLGA